MMQRAQRVLILVAMLALVGKAGAATTTWFLNAYVFRLDAPPSTPSVSRAGEARLYFKPDAGAVQVSVNGGAYSPLGAGLALSGATNTLPKITGDAALGDSAMTDDGTQVAVNLDGTAVAPAMSFGVAADTGTGIYHPTAGTLAFSAGGVEQVRVNTAVGALSGSLRVKASDTGNAFCITNAGTACEYGVDPGLFMDSFAGGIGSISTSDIVGAFTPLDIQSNPIRVSGGIGLVITGTPNTAAQPELMFDSADPNTGIYHPAADQIGISTNGTERLRVANATTTITNAIDSLTSIFNTSSSTCGGLTAGAVCVADALTVSGNMATTGTTDIQGATSNTSSNTCNGYDTGEVCFLDNVSITGTGALASLSVYSTAATNNGSQLYMFSSGSGYASTNTYLGTPATGVIRTSFGYAGPTAADADLADKFFFEAFASKVTSFTVDSDLAAGTIGWEWRDNVGGTGVQLMSLDGAGNLFLNASATRSKGTCTLNGGSPSTCTATVVASSVCACSPVGTTAAIAAGGCAVSLASTTLTLTSANGLTNVVNYHCL